MYSCLCMYLIMKHTWHHMKNILCSMRQCSLLQSHQVYLRV
jgi:hypothetical protein